MWLIDDGLAIEKNKSFYDFYIDIKEKIIYRPKGICYIGGLNNEYKTHLISQGYILTNKINKADFGILFQGLYFAEKYNTKYKEKEVMVWTCSKTTRKQIQMMWDLPKLIHLEDLLSYKGLKTMSSSEYHNLYTMFKSEDKENKKLAYSLLKNYSAFHCGANLYEINDCWNRDFNNNLLYQTPSNHLITHPIDRYNNKKVLQFVSSDNRFSNIGTYAVKIYF